MEKIKKYFKNDRFAEWAGIEILEIKRRLVPGKNEYY